MDEADDPGQRYNPKYGGVIIVDNNGKVIGERVEHEEEKQDEEIDNERDRRKH